MVFSTLAAPSPLSRRDTPRIIDAPEILGLTLGRDAFESYWQDRFTRSTGTSLGVSWDIRQRVYTYFSVRIVRRSFSVSERWSRR